MANIHDQKEGIIIGNGKKEKLADTLVRGKSLKKWNIFFTFIRKPSLFMVVVFK